MSVRRSILCLAIALCALSAGSALAIYQSDCPQVCTPSCPCSVVCQGPFGPTTCGQAGEPCTNLASDPGDDAEVLFAPAFLTTAEAPTEEPAETAAETAQGLDESREAAQDEEPAGEPAQE